jgi:hypothetical protein
MQERSPSTGFSVAVAIGQLVAVDRVLDAIAAVLESTAKMVDPAPAPKRGPWVAL